MTLCLYVRGLKTDILNNSPSPKYVVTIFCLSSALSALFILFCFAFISPFDEHFL